MKLASIIIGALVVAAIAFVVVLLLVKLMWAWTVPDLFPGAVEQGLVAAEISWLSSLKVALIVAILSGGVRGGSAGAHKSRCRRKADDDGNGAPDAPGCADTASSD